MQEFARQLQKEPPSKNRMKLVHDLDKAIMATEAVVETTMNLHYAIAISALMTLPEEKQKPFGEIRKEIEQSKPQIKKIVNIQVITSFLYTYRSLKDTEIEYYLNFVSSEAGKAFNLASIEGLRNGLLKCGFQWGEAIAQILKSAETKSET
jgi:hypothetical protein